MPRATAHAYMALSTGEVPPSAVITAQVYRVHYQMTCIQHPVLIAMANSRYKRTFGTGITLNPNAHLVEAEFGDQIDVVLQLHGAAAFRRNSQIAQKRLNVPIGHGMREQRINRGRKSGPSLSRCRDRQQACQHQCP